MAGIPQPQQLQSVPAPQKQGNKSSPPFPQPGPGPVQALFKDCEGICYLSGQKTHSRDGKLDFPILVSFNKPEGSQKDYAQRWQIEA